MYFCTSYLCVGKMLIICTVHWIVTAQLPQEPSLSFMSASLDTKNQLHPSIVPNTCVETGAARGRAKEPSMSPSKFLENIVILGFERRFYKQNSVIRLKSNTLVPQISGPATPLRWNLPKELQIC